MPQPARPSYLIRCTCLRKRSGATYLVKMGDLLKFVLSQEDRFRRYGGNFRTCSPPPSLTQSSPRLPSLFSDFTLQRQTNPSGYTANVETWEAVLCEAARARLVSRQDGSNPMFSLEIGPHLLQQLESKQWGRPLALDAVFVGIYISISS